MSTLRFAGLTAALGFLFRSLLPWWSIALGGAIAGVLMPRHLGRSFGGGFLGAALLWGGYAAILNASNDSLLAGKMGQLLGGLPAWALIIVTAVLGGIYGGLGGIVGSQLRRVFWAPKA